MASGLYCKEVTHNMDRSGRADGGGDKRHWVREGLEQWWEGVFGKDIAGVDFTGFVH